LDDHKTYEMLGRGETVGVFQLESAGMRDALRNMKADRFEDIIALVALYRPGPMDNIPRYNACKAGLEEPDYLHPKLEPILKETFGVMIYQEQVMQIAQVLSGYSLGGADLLRRAMGKKIKAEMEAQRDTFVKGAVERGVDEAKAGQIFDQVDKFAGYGFNKSHAAAYALVAYQTAWLKANHPVEFLAAIMTLDLGNTEKLNVFKQELERLSIPLLPPDINDSEGEFSVRQQPDGQSAVRYALGAIKGVGVQAMDAVVEERTENGPYKDAFAFAARVGGKAANKRQLENLIRAGAFDGLDKNRRKLFEGAEKLVRMAAAAERDRETNQVSLFDAQPEAIAATRPSLPEIEDWPVLEKLNEELNAVGFYLSAHPLDAYGGALKRVGVVPFSGLTPSAAGSQPKLAGVVVAKRERTSARGNRFAFIQFSGPDGMFEVVAFSEALGAGRELLESGKPILISCEARADNGELKLSAQGFEDLDAAVARTGAGLKVRLAQPDALAAIKRAVEKSRKGGKGRVSLVLDIGDAQEVEVALPGGYSISAEMRAAIDAVPGVLELQDT
jgi:DNA polymerase-3 subunit alpha